MQTEEYENLFRHEDRYWWFVGRRKLALRLLSRFMPKRDSSLLDLGCGTGAVLSELEQSGRAIGVDMSPLALGFCRARGLSNLVLADGERLPFKGDRFRAVVALDLFEHVPDDVGAVQESFRVLEPDGILVASVPAFRKLWGPHDVALMHQRRYTRSEFVGILKEAGFTITRASYGVFFLFPLVVLVRLIEKFRAGPAKVSLPSVPRWLNKILISVQSSEGSLIERISLPWGSSVVVVARKPRQKQPRPRKFREAGFVSAKSLA